MRLELAPGKVIETFAYNGMVPGRALRLREGRQVSIDIRNDVDDIIHWHGLYVPSEVDGAMGEGSPRSPIHGATSAARRFDWGTVHFNLQASWRASNVLICLFIDTIIEGPHTWKVRAVAEFFYECEFGQAQTASALVGLIWQVQDKLAFDLAVREARANGQPVNEIRAGLTTALTLAVGRNPAREPFTLIVDLGWGDVRHFVTLARYGTVHHLRQGHDWISPTR
jgi:Multicopper oxidase